MQSHRELADGRRVRLVGEVAVDHRRLDEARAHAVGPDARLRAVERQALREHDDARLGGAVRRVVGDRPQPGDRGGRHDRAAAALQEVRPQRLGDEVDALEVDRELAVPVVLGEVVGRAGDRDAGVVDDDVDAAERLDAAVHAGRDVRAAGDVHVDAVAVRARRADLRRGLRAVSPRRSATATRAPSSAKRSAVARPIPDPPPVTSATFPSSLPMSRSFRRPVSSVTARARR